MEGLDLLLWGRIAEAALELLAVQAGQLAILREQAVAAGIPRSARRFQEVAEAGQEH